VSVDPHRERRQIGRVARRSALDQPPADHGVEQRPLTVRRRLHHDEVLPGDDPAHRSLAPANAANELEIALRLGRRFVALPGAVRVPPPLQLGRGGVDLAVEEALGGDHLLGVGAAVDACRARRRAAADLPVQARCDLGRRTQTGAAGAQPEKARQQRLRLHRRGAAAKRPEVAPGPPP
jgi:hypothetical protein